MYGTQTCECIIHSLTKFENDVKMYGTQTDVLYKSPYTTFENDVKMYGTQTMKAILCQHFSLRMM